jgi:hypothetical protein
MPTFNNSALTSFPKPQKRKKKKGNYSGLRFAKSPRIDNPKYKAWIISLPCLITRRPGPNDPHHVPKKGHAAEGQKTDDTRCIPLCHRLHVELHTIGRDTFAAKYGLDYEAIIERLNKLWEEK